MRLFQSRVTMAIAVFIASFVPLFTSVPSYAGGAGCAWTGTAGNHLFSTAANWTGICTGVGGIPGNGDNLTFDTTLTDLSPQNDLTGLSVANINFVGTGTGYYTLTGNDLSVSVAIYDGSTTGSTLLSLNLILTADVTATLNAADIGYTASVTPFTLTLGGHTLTVHDAGNFRGSYIESTIAGAGNISVTGGILNLTGTNTSWSGTATVASTADLLPAKASALGSTAVNISAGGRLSFCSDNGNVTIPNNITVAQTGTTNAIEFSGCYSNSVAQTLTFTGSIALTSNVSFGSFDAVNQAIHVNGPLSGAFTLGVGAGQNITLTIASSSNTSLSPNSTQNATRQTLTYSDSQPGIGITVSGLQTVIVDGTRGAVTVLSGGILGGHGGTVGTINVSSGGHLAPGGTPGCLNSGNVTLVAGANFDEDIAGATACTQFSQQNVTGTVNLGGATLNVILSYVPVAGTKFKIINNDGVDPIVGTFAGLTDGATVTANGYNFTISYLGGDGNDVELTAVAPVVVPALPAAARAHTTLPIALGLLAILAVAGIEVGRRARLRR